MSHPAFSETFRSGRTRANVVVALLALTGLVSLFSALQDIAGFDLIRKAEEGTLTAAEATGFDEATQALAGGYALAFVVTAIAFLAWLSRTVDNMPKLSDTIPAVTPRWSIGWWFIPFANLFKPYQIVKDVRARLATDEKSGGDWIVLAWWIVWLGGGLIGTILSRLPEPSTVEALSGWFTLGFIVDATGVAAAVLAILVVRQIQARADERARGLVSEASGSRPNGASAPKALPPCPRCGSPREAGQQICGTCGLDLWAAYDQGKAGKP